MNAKRTANVAVAMSAFLALVLGTGVAVFGMGAADTPATRMPTAMSVQAVPGDWEAYTNVAAGFSIQYPPSWTEEPQPAQPGGTIQAVTITGTEGGVDLMWGAGFGGACPPGPTTIQVAQGTLQACYSQAPDGTESWTQIYKDRPVVGFGANAWTSNAEPASHDLVLQVLSTLTFMTPAPDPITPRMLIQPGALMGPAPSSFKWSPVGAVLAYVAPQNGVDSLWRYDAATGDQQVLFDASIGQPVLLDPTTAQWSPQGDRLLLVGETSFWLVDAKTGELQPLVEDKNGLTGLLFSPDGARVAYVQDNDLYVVTVADGAIQRLTSDGSETVFNGAMDWVYNEELATRSDQPAFAWSPDGGQIVYLRLDESGVQSHSVTNYQPVPPTLSYTRYPTAGSANPVASVHVVAVDGGEPAQAIALAGDVEYVLPLFAWTPDGQEAVYMTLNRAHTVLKLEAWNPATGAGRTLIEETDPYWITENSYAGPIFLNGGKEFLWLSERDGFMHLYRHSAQGELIQQVTQGEWMIDTPAWNVLTPGRPVDVDPSDTWAYFSSTKNGPLERQVYRVNLADGRLEQISQDAGLHFSALSADGNYLVDQFSNVDTPPATWIVQADGTRVELLGQADGPGIVLPDVTREFVTIQADDGTELYGQLVKPADFDPAKKYPIVIHWYGGPTLQLVSNRYGATNIFNMIERDVLYTQAGFLVWRLDNRGSFGRGHAFETPIAKQLGVAALEDQLAGVDYLRTLPYVDSARIGVDGKSFGGFLTLYALINAPDVFACGVAGAAPTDWAYYDTIYTERYMQTPEQNPDGYQFTNLIAGAEKLVARPLLIHGLNDRNVHLQNTVNFIQELEALDKPFDFIALPNMDHSFKGDGLAAALSASTDYFVRCLEEQ